MFETIVQNILNDIHCEDREALLLACVKERLNREANNYYANLSANYDFVIQNGSDKLLKLLSEKAKREQNKLMKQEQETQRDEGDEGLCGNTKTALF